MPDDPAKSDRPSGKVTVLAFAVDEPSFARQPTTVTSAPTGKSACRHPRRYSALGRPNSTLQFSVLPEGLFTSMYSQACGLIHFIVVIVPFNVTGLFESNSAENE